MPQPNVMTIQPLFCPLDWFSSTHATTPLPSRIRSAVPITSAPKMLKSLSSSPSSCHCTQRCGTLPAPSGNVKRVRRQSPNRRSDTSRPMAATIQSIERAAAILRLLSGRNRRLGVVQLAGELELPKGTVHGILRTLAAVGFVEQDAEIGQVPARRRAAAHGQLLPRRQRAAHARAELVGLAGRAQRRERAHRHAARGPGARRPPRLPARRQPPGARGRRAAAGARDRDGQGAAGREPLRRGRAGRRGAGPLHAARRSPSATRSTAELRRRDASAAGPTTSRSSWPARPPSPRRSRTGAASTVGAIGISGPVERLIERRRRRAAISCPTCARRRGRSRATSGRSRGRKGAVSERYIAVGRPGHGVLALPRLRPRSADRVRQPDRAPSRSSRARATSSTTREEIWRNVQYVDRATRSPRSTARRRATSSALGHHQPARDDRAVGPRDRRAGAQRDHLAGHAHRPAGARARRRRGRRPLPRPLRAAARHLLLRAEDPLAARPRPRPARARRGRRGAASGRWTPG